jgi:hypothetical protein
MTKDEIVNIFLHTNIEGYYNFLEDDLVKLANAFVDAAAPKIALAERTECIMFVESLNRLVAEALIEKRGKI